MIILDTNVISELMKDAPDSAVGAWAQSVSPSDFWITSITIAEILLGIERLPYGQRKQALARAAEHWIDHVVHDRVLAFGDREARTYARLVARRLEAGRPIGIPDAQIAAIALAHGATLATRNIQDFAGTGVSLVNPWVPPDTP